MSALDPFHKITIALLETGSGAKSVSIVLPKNEFWCVLAEHVRLERATIQSFRWPVKWTLVVIQERSPRGADYDPKVFTPAFQMREVALPDTPSFTMPLGGIHFTFVRGEDR